MFIKHNLLQIPKDIIKETAKITILNIVIALSFDFIAFFLQLGKDQIAAGRIVLGLVLIAIYYCTNTLHTFLNLWVEDIDATYKENYTRKIEDLIVQLLLRVRGKVWRKNEKTQAREIMTTNNILFSCQNYISLVWGLKTGIPKYIFELISVLLMFCGFIAVTTFEIEHTFLFVAIICVITIMSIFFSMLRMKSRQKRKKQRKETSEVKNNVRNDILNIEPISEEHAKYMADNYIEANKQIYSFDRKDRKAINKINIVESITKTLSTLTIIAIKVYESGLRNVNLEVVLAIISLVAIYSQIMNKVTSIIHRVENCRNQLKDISIYSKDFSEILKIFDATPTTETFGTISQLDVPSFRVQYEALGCEQPFTLLSNSDITLLPNDVVLLTGPTGSGKSTFMHMITGAIKFDGFDLKYINHTGGSILSAIHQPDGRLGCNTVLSEITLGKTPEREKLIDILKGLHLYEEILQKDEDVFRYLETSHFENFSNGQRQRLSIARLLYNINESVQIVAFDEATNALNDEVTIQTLEFIKAFCKGKILLIATHQVAISTKIATKHIEFSPKGDHYEVTTDF